MSPERQTAVADAHALLDEQRDKLAEASTRLGRPPVCSKGCFHCCKEPVAAARQEVEYLLAGLDDAQRAAVADRTRRWLAQVVGSGILNEAMRAPFVFYWRALNAWCPLLVDGICSVYDRRPMSCRAHVAVASPELCADDAGRLRQVFILSETEMFGPAQLAANLEGETMQYDDLGLYLAEILLGRKVPHTCQWTPYRAEVDPADPSSATLIPL